MSEQKIKTKKATTAEAGTTASAAKKQVRQPKSADVSTLTPTASDVPNFKRKYTDEIVASMVEKFNYKSVMQAPKIDKIVINVGAGDASSNSKVIEEVLRDISLISGQKPLSTKAKKSIAGFKLREGVEIGAKVTLRGDRMYYFLEKLINISLPRVRDFRGVSANAFDGRGNYTLGIKEQLIFPEIDYDKITKIRGMDIVIVTTALNDEEGRELLQQFGLPFAK